MELVTKLNQKVSIDWIVVLFFQNLAAGMVPSWSEVNTMSIRGLRGSVASSFESFFSPKCLPDIRIFEINTISEMNNRLVVNKY